MPELDYLCGNCGRRLISLSEERKWNVACNSCWYWSANPDIGWGDTIEDALDAYRDSCDIHDRPGPMSIHDLEEIQAEGEAILQELGPRK